MVKALAIAAGSGVALMGLIAAVSLAAPPAHAQSGPTTVQALQQATYTCDPADGSDASGRVALGIWQLGPNLDAPVYRAGAGLSTSIRTVHYTFPSSGSWEVRCASSHSSASAQVYSFISVTVTSPPPGPTTVQGGQQVTYNCDPANGSDDNGRVALGIWQLGPNLDAPVYRAGASLSTAIRSVNYTFLNSGSWEVRCASSHSSASAQVYSSLSVTVTPPPPGPTTVQVGQQGTFYCDPANGFDASGRVALGIWQLGPNLNSPSYRTGASLSTYIRTVNYTFPTAGTYEVRCASSYSSASAQVYSFIRVTVIAAPGDACQITGPDSLTIVNRDVSANYDVYLNTGGQNVRLYWSGPGNGGLSSQSATAGVSNTPWLERSFTATVNFDTPGTWTLTCRDHRVLATKTVTVTSAPVRAPDAPGDSVVLTRSGATGQVPLCEPITLNLSVVYQPVAATDTLDYAIQEEDGSGSVTGIIKRLTVSSHSGTGAQKVTMTESVAHCSGGARHYRGVRQLEQVGGQDSELVTVEWAGNIQLNAFDTRAELNSNITLRTEVYPLDWDGATIELQERGIHTSQGRWETSRSAAAYTRSERAAIAALTVSQATAGGYQYRWKLVKDDITVYSNVILLYWATPLPTPTPYVAREQEAENQNEVELQPDERYTAEAPDVVSYQVSPYQCGEADGAFFEVTFLPVRHAQHYELYVDDALQTLIDDSGPAGYVTFCQGQETGSGEMRLTGLIDNRQNRPYELEVNNQKLIVLADSVVYTSPALLTLNWDVNAVSNPFLGPGAAAGEPPGNEPLEGVEDLAILLAGVVGASPQRVDFLLPLLCIVLATGLAAGIVWPLGWSPPAAGAGLIVFVLIWTVSGPAWFGVPLGMALALTLVVTVAGATVAYQRIA